MNPESFAVIAALGRAPELSLLKKPFRRDIYSHWFFCAGDLQVSLRNQKITTTPFDHQCPAQPSVRTREVKAYESCLSNGFEGRLWSLPLRRCKPNLTVIYPVDMPSNANDAPTLCDCQLEIHAAESNRESAIPVIDFLIAR